MRTCATAPPTVTVVGASSGHTGPVTRLLATDLDGTLEGDDTATRRLLDALAEAGIVVAFATGRHLASVFELYDRWGTDHRAAACVTMVGTEIWHRDGDEYRRDDTWTAALTEGWDRERVDAVVRECLDGELQPAEWQSPAKSSWFVDGDDRGVERLRRRLAEHGPSSQVVYSASRFVDVMPPGAGKGAAVAHLAATLRIDPADVVVAGDTGNDIDMMRPELGFAAVVVGNATAELAELDGAHIYKATAHHAEGIVEGLVRRGWL